MYAKLNNIAKAKCHVKMLRGQKSISSTTTKQTSTHKHPCRRRESNTGTHSGTLPVDHRIY